MGPIGMQEMVVIFLVALVLFGPKKLPELGKTIAKAVTEFRRAQSDLKATFDREMQSIERESESLKEATRQAAAEMSAFGDIDLISGNVPYDAASIDSAHTPTVSASAIPGAESPTEAEKAAEVARLLDPSAAALEPGVDYGQPAVTPGPEHAAVSAVPETTIAEGAGAEAPANPAETSPTVATAANPAAAKSQPEPEAVQHS